MFIVKVSSKLTNFVCFCTNKDIILIELTQTVDTILYIVFISLIDCTIYCLLLLIIDLCISEEVEQCSYNGF